MAASMNPDSTGRAVQIVRVKEDLSMELDEEALKSVLLQEAFKDLPVVVVSVAGKYRQGKSFLLGFLMRYLQLEGSEAWVTENGNISGGFASKAGRDRVTTGILLWSEPIIGKLPNGEAVAVLFMDTQGTDDIKSDVAHDVPIFALSAILSSMFIFNVRDVGIHDLDSLSLFLGYGSLASKTEQKSSVKPFQDLFFLVRDWKTPKDHPHGLKGGNDYLQYVAKAVKGIDLNRALHDAFSKVSCFLMPHPGLTVDSDEFGGDVDDIEKKFLVQMRDFVELVLAPSNLVVKKDLGKKIVVSDLVQLFKHYFLFFADGKCPTPGTLYETNRMKSYVTALILAKSSMDAALAHYDTSPYDEDLEKQLEVVAEAARKTFQDTQKLGASHDFDLEYSAMLEEYVAECVERQNKVNRAKKVILDLEEEKVALAEKARIEMKAKEEEMSKLRDDQIQEKLQAEEEMNWLKDKHEKEQAEKEEAIKKMEMDRVVALAVAQANAAAAVRHAEEMASAKYSMQMANDNLTRENKRLNESMCTIQ